MVPVICVLCFLWFDNCICNYYNIYRCSIMHGYMVRYCFVLCFLQFDKFISYKNAKNKTHLRLEGFVFYDVIASCYTAKSVSIAHEVDIKMLQAQKQHKYIHILMQVCYLIQNWLNLL